MEIAKNNIYEWYEHWEGKVHVGFSGGKDSQAMLHLVRTMYPDVPAVYVNTGLEWPETKKVIRETENIITLRPKMPFHKVIVHYGWPVISKVTAKKLKEIQRGKTLYNRQRRMMGTVLDKVPTRWLFMIEAPFLISDMCCVVMKKNPKKEYEKKTGRKPYIDLLADESRNRKVSHIKYGCNKFKDGDNVSRPIMSWSTEDVWRYIRENKIKYAEIYDKGLSQTGCIFCCFGLHLDQSPNRFQVLKSLHPKLHRYVVDKLGLDKICDFMGLPYE